MPGEYKFRMFMDETGEIDFIRKSCFTELAADVGPDDVIIPVTDLLEFYGGDLSGLVNKQFVNRVTIDVVELNVEGDGSSRTLVTPDYWADNPVTVTVDGDPVTFEFTNNQLVLDDPPDQGSAVTATVTVEGITLPPLASSQPRVTVNASELSENDFTVDNTPTNTRIVLVTPLSQGDVFGVELTYLSSGATVAWINNERIEYYGVDLERDLLLQCQRGTRVTAKRAHPQGTVVWEGSERHSARAQFEKTGINYFAPELFRETREFLSQDCPDVSPTPPPIPTPTPTP